MSLLFADLCDYTLLGELHDPEEVDELRTQLELLAQRVVQHHGGSVTQMYGDGMLAVFGFPQPREDDPRRAVGAAVELRDAVRELRLSGPSADLFECRLHSGVHAGLVFARQGDELNGRYTLTGDAVSTAARLCSAAQRDEIVISEAMRHSIDGFFALSTLADDVTLKGKKLPITTYRVLGGLGARSSFQARCRRGLTDFVGRDDELQALASALENALCGQARVVVLHGAAGVGKSRVLEEFRRRIAVPQLCTLQGYCEPYGDVVPLQPFLQVLRQLCGLSSTDDSEESIAAARTKLSGLVSDDDVSLAVLLQLLSLQPAGCPQHEITEQSIVRAFRSLWHALLRQAPVLLLLDDWQWADDVSRKVLSSLTLTAADSALCVVIAERTSQLIDQVVTGELLEIAPFDSRESDRVVRALRGQSLPPTVARALHERSGGNPLFLEELCRFLPSPAFGGEALLDRASTPITLQGVIQARLAALPEADARVLQTASIIGSEFAAELLVELCPEQDVGASLDVVVREDLVYALERTGFYRFKHGITREVVYESVRVSERRALHAAIAARLIEDIAPEALSARAEALAYHYRGCADHQRAAQFGEQAGDKAMSTLALDRARLQYSLALVSLGMLDSSPEFKRRFVAISTRWAGACIYSPSRDQLDLLTRASRYADELGEQHMRAEGQNLIGWILYVLGDYNAAERHFRVALRQTTEDTRLYAQLQANLGQCFAAAGEYDQALSHLSESIERKRLRTRSGQHHLAEGSAYALGCRAAIYGDRGDFLSADRDVTQALSLIGESGFPIASSVWCLAAMVEIQRGDLSRSFEAAEKSRAIAERVNSHYAYATASAYAAFARFMLQGEPEALQQLRNCVDWLEERGTHLFLSFAQGCLAHAASVAGERSLVEAYALRALKRLGQRDPLGEALAYRALARAHGHAGQVDDASVVPYLQQALAAADRRDSPRERALTLQLAAALAPTAFPGAQNAQRELDEMGVRFEIQRR